MLYIIKVCCIDKLFKKGKQIWIIVKTSLPVCFLLRSVQTSCASECTRKGTSHRFPRASQLCTHAGVLVVEKLGRNVTKLGSDFWSLKYNCHFVVLILLGVIKLDFLSTVTTPNTRLNKLWIQLASWVWEHDLYDDLPISAEMKGTLTSRYGWASFYQMRNHLFYSVLIFMFFF